MILQEKTNEELIDLIWNCECIDAAYGQLFLNLRPMIFKIAYKHLRPIPIYDQDDYFQEGCLLIWRLISENKYVPGALFSNLFYTAFDRKCINLYRDYVLRNWLLISESDDIYCYGYQYGYYVEADFVQEYKEKQRKRHKALYDRKHPPEEKAPPRPVLSEEERKERNRQQSREYYQAHKEKCRQAKRDWYQKNHAYALQYQKAYAKGVRIGKKGPVPKPKKS